MWTSVKSADRLLARYVIRTLTGVTPRGRARITPGAARAGLAGLAIALAAGLSGCAVPARASAPTMVVDTAFVGAPQGSDRTDGYLIIRNNGPADRLVAVRTSVGGSVTFSAPGPDGPAVMRTISTAPIPAHSLTRLTPNGTHLVITGAGPMKAGRDITLTLIFARARPVRIAAEVTDPETGGSSYFLN